MSATSAYTGRPMVSFRDDGPVAGALGRAGRGIGAPPALLVFLGAVVLFAGVAAEGSGASNSEVGIALLLFILFAGITAERPDEGRFRWVAAPVLRAGEYGALIWMGAIAGGSGVAAAFALLCALAFRHYDLVYRFRHQGLKTPEWVGVLALGWAGRLIGAYVLLVLDAFPTGIFVAAGVLGAVFVVESASSWLRADVVEATDAFEDDEEDEED